MTGDERGTTVGATYEKEAEASESIVDRWVRAVAGFSGRRLGKDLPDREASLKLSLLRKNFPGAGCRVQRWVHVRKYSKSPWTWTCNTVGPQVSTHSWSAGCTSSKSDGMLSTVVHGYYQEVSSYATGFRLVITFCGRNVSKRSQGKLRVS